jgi:hypothetical protein
VPERTLGERVAGFRGKLVVSTAGDDPAVLVWRADAVEPRRFALEPGIVLSTLDASGSHVAGFSESRMGPTVLWLGTPAGIDPMATGVREHLWHPSSPGLMAYVVDDAEGTRSLYTVALPSEASAVTEIRRVDVEIAENEFLTEWGDWGFAFQGIDPTSGPDAVRTFDLEGNLLGERDAFVWRVSPDGVLYLGLVDEDGVLEEVQSDPTLSELVPIDAPWPGDAEWVEWSPDGSRSAWVGGDGAMVTVRQGGTARGQVIGEGRLRGLSSEGTWVVLEYEPDLPIGAGIALWNVDLGEVSRLVVPVASIADIVVVETDSP